MNFGTAYPPCHKDEMGAGLQWHYDIERQREVRNVRRGKGLESPLELYVGQRVFLQVELVLVLQQYSTVQYKYNTVQYSTVQYSTVQYSTVILGLNFQHNLTWKSHLEHGNKPLLPSLRQNLGALKHTGKLIPMGSRNTLARGLIISRLSYLIGIWGGATPNLLRRAQAIQNMAARWITNKGRRVKTSILMEQTGWFSIDEITKLSSANTIWKIIHMKTPRKLHDKLSWDQNTLKFNIQQPRIEFTKSNFSFRACTEWNQIPDAIRNIKSIGSFKKHMKTWMRSLRPRMPDW